MKNIIEQFNTNTISIDLQEFADTLMQGYNDNNRKFIKGDFMKKMSFAMLVTGMAAGAGAYAAYQKYNKPMMNKVEKVVNKSLKTANDKLEDMM